MIAPPAFATSVVERVALDVLECEALACSVASIAASRAGLGVAAVSVLAAAAAATTASVASSSSGRAASCAALPSARSLPSPVGRLGGGVLALEVAVRLLEGA